MLVDPSAPTHRALQRVGLVSCGTIAWTPYTFTTSAYGSNTGSIGARERTGRRTERGKEVFLVVVGGADVMDEVVADRLRAERAPSRLF